MKATAATRWDLRRVEETEPTMAIKVGDNIVAQQADDGSWIFGPEALKNDVTAEMVVWLDEIHQAVGLD